jgi:hypothetical protein
MVVAFSLGLPLGLGASALAWFAVRLLRMYQRVRAVACPETREPVAIRIDAPHAALTALAGKVDYRLTSCSRWPEKRNCDQACRSQIEGATQGCNALATIEKTKRIKNCEICGVVLERKRPSDPKPVLMSPDRKTRIEWENVPPERLLTVLTTHSQICWTCHMTESYASIRSGDTAASPARRASPFSAVS